MFLDGGKKLEKPYMNKENMQTPHREAQAGWLSLMVLIILKTLHIAKLNIDNMHIKAIQSFA